MSRLFKSILIPVDFSDNTEVAISQSLELACTNGSIIHLLHVVRSKSLWSVLPINKTMDKLDELKCAIEESVPYCKVNTSVTNGNICRNIEQAAKQIKPQLIVIGKSKNHKLFSWFHSVCPNRLAKSTGCPVLTVMQNKSDPGIKVIVVPVGSFIPYRKIELVIELAKKYKATIHLVTIPNEIHFKETKGNSFLETYRILRAGLTSPIEYHILKGNNLPKAVLEYAECVWADLILVNPGSETKISNLSGKHINDVLATSSKLKILSILPYHSHQLSVYSKNT